MENLLLLKKIDVVRAFGGTLSLAEKYGVTRQAIYAWPEVISGKAASHILFLSNAYGIDINAAIIKKGD